MSPPHRSARLVIGKKIVENNSMEQKRTFLAKAGEAILIYGIGVPMFIVAQGILGGRLLEFIGLAIFKERFKRKHAVFAFSLSILTTASLFVFVVGVNWQLIVIGIFVAFVVLALHCKRNFSTGGSFEEMFIVIHMFFILYCAFAAPKLESFVMQKLGEVRQDSPIQ